MSVPVAASPDRAQLEAALEHYRDLERGGAFSGHTRAILKAAVAWRDAMDVAPADDGARTAGAVDDQKAVMVDRVALAIWQAREVRFAERVRRMAPDDLDRASGAWNDVVILASAAIEASGAADMLAALLALREADAAWAIAAEGDYPTEREKTKACHDASKQRFVAWAGACAALAKAMQPVEAGKARGQTEPPQSEIAS